MIIAELLGKVGFQVESHGLEAVKEQLEGIQHKVSFLAAAEVLHGLFELAERFGGVGEQINTLALQAGLTAEEFQKLAFAAHQNGIGQEEMSGALAKLSRNLYAARQGGQQAVKAFDDLGITPEQVSSFRNGGEAIRAVADRIAAVDDPIRRQALTMQLLGRGSSRMIKLLARGGEAFDKYGERAEAMGAILKNEQVENLEKTEEALAALGDAFKALAGTLGAALAPALVELSDKMGDFLVQNRALIQEKLELWAEKAAFVFGFVFEVIKNCAQAMGNFVAKHPELTENLLKVYFAALMFALGMHALEAVMTLVLSPVRKFLGLLKVIPWALLAFRSGLVGVMEAVASMVFGALPRFALLLLDISKALELMSAGTFALWIGGIVLAVGTLVTLLHDCWALMRGGKLEDLWLYKIGQYIGGKLLSSLNAVRRFLGMDELKAEDILPESRQAQMQREKSQYELLVGPAQGNQSRVQDDRSGAFLDADYQARGPQMSIMANNALDNLSAISMPTASETLKSMTTAPDIRQEFNIDARATITVPPGASPAEFEEAIKRANEEKIQKVLRDAHASLQTAVAQ